MSTTLLLFTLLFSAQPSFTNTGEETHAIELPTVDPCPVRFRNFPNTVESYELNGASLVGGAQDRAIALLREDGLFLISVTSPDSEPIYGSRRTKAGETIEYALSMGLRGMNWTTAAGKDAEYVSEVPPGLYRVVLQYISSSDAGTWSACVCIAISPTFELTQRQYLHRFE